MIWQRLRNFTARIVYSLMRAHCKEEHFWRDVSGMDEICVDFEYKNEFKN